ncbi:hypothetical protein PilKf_01901 [Pillotina sp. SPG140]|jgi:hypothetical protein
MYALYTATRLSHTETRPRTFIRAGEGLSPDAVKDFHTKPLTGTDLEGTDLEVRLTSKGDRPLGSQRLVIWSKKPEALCVLMQKLSVL